MSKIKESDDCRSAALTSTFLDIRSSLIRLVGKIVRRDDVDDILEETFVRTYEHFGETEIAFPKALLYKTARNLALNHIARHENCMTHSLEDMDNPDVYLASEELESQIEAQEKYQLFCSIVESLPPKCREAFLLKRVYGWPTKAIAAKMKISVSTAEKHIAKGLLLCADGLQKMGYDLRGAVRTRDNQKKVGVDSA